MGVASANAEVISLAFIAEIVIVGHGGRHPVGPGGSVRGFHEFREWHFFVGDKAFPIQFQAGRRPFQNRRSPVFLSQPVVEQEKVCNRIKGALARALEFYGAGSRDGAVIQVVGSQPLPRFWSDPHQVQPLLIGSGA